MGNRNNYSFSNPNCYAAVQARRQEAKRQTYCQPVQCQAVATTYQDSFAASASFHIPSRAELQAQAICQGGNFLIDQKNNGGQYYKLGNEWVLERGSQALILRNNEWQCLDEASKTKLQAFKDRTPELEEALDSAKDKTALSNKLLFTEKSVESLDGLITFEKGDHSHPILVRKKTDGSYWFHTLDWNKGEWGEITETSNPKLFKALREKYPNPVTEQVPAATPTPLEPSAADAKPYDTIPVKPETTPAPLAKPKIPTYDEDVPSEISPTKIKPDATTKPINSGEDPFTDPLPITPNTTSVSNDTIDLPSYADESIDMLGKLLTVDIGGSKFKLEINESSFPGSFHAMQAQVPGEAEPRTLMFNIYNGPLDEETLAILESASNIKVHKNSHNYLVEIGLADIDEAPKAEATEATSAPMATTPEAESKSTTVTEPIAAPEAQAAESAITNPKADPITEPIETTATKLAETTTPVQATIPVTNKPAVTEQTTPGFQLASPAFLATHKAELDYLVTRLPGTKVETLLKTRKRDLYQLTNADGSQQLVFMNKQRVPVDSWGNEIKEVSWNLSYKDKYTALTVSTDSLTPIPEPQQKQIINFHKNLDDLGYWKPGNATAKHNPINPSHSQDLKTGTNPVSLTPEQIKAIKEEYPTLEHDATKGYFTKKNPKDSTICLYSAHPDDTDTKLRGMLIAYDKQGQVLNINSEIRNRVKRIGAKGAALLSTQTEQAELVKLTREMCVLINSGLQKSFQSNYKPITQDPFTQKKDYARIITLLDKADPSGQLSKDLEHAVDTFLKF